MAKKEETKVGGPVFTYSRLDSFMTCERKEWFQYQAGGNGIVTVMPQTPFIEGEFGHYALKHWYANAKRGGLMLRENMEKRIKIMLSDLGIDDPAVLDGLNKKMSAMIGACHGYKIHYRSDLDKFKVLFVEEPFEVEIGGITIRGRMDLGLEDANGMKGMVEHKFRSQFSVDDFNTLPLSIQQLLYCEGFKQKTGKYPDWYMLNIVKKSQLRLKQNESTREFEERVKQQYIDEPERMFFRTPPLTVETAMIEAAQRDIVHHIKMWSTMPKDTPPPARYSGCQGKYGSCAYGPACVALATGKGAEGWNSAQCSALYRKKEALHPELVKSKDDDDYKEVKESK